MDDKEQQEEEREVLKSIYEGDDAFKEVDSTTFQYKYGEEENKSFVLEIKWSPTYPTEKPNINVDIFYNRNLVPIVKEKILELLNGEAEQWIGSAMTYTLFECLKEKFQDIIELQTDENITSIVEQVPKIALEEQQEETAKKEKKEQLTKAQKRRAWDRAEQGKGGDKPRGWDWVDLIRHLSQVPHNPTPVS